MAQRHTPFGYKIIDGAVTVEPEKADLVRKIFNDFISGISLKQMAKDLTEMKVPNANGKPSWNHGSIGKILSNCKYTGSDFYPAIIPMEVFNAANRLREENNARLGRNVNYFANGISSTYPFSGRLICGECGSIFKRYTEHHDKNKRCNWKCKRYIVDNKVCCKSGVVDDKQLEAGFIQIINRVMESPEMIEKRPAVNAVAESAELRKIKMQISSVFGKYVRMSLSLLTYAYSSAYTLYKRLLLSTILPFSSIYLTGSSNMYAVSVPSLFAKITVRRSDSFLYRRAT
jgi:site-specific DNA recombinase